MLGPDAQAQTATESANILAGTQSLTLTEALKVAAYQKLLADARRPRLNTAAKATLVIVIDDQPKSWWNGTINGVAIRTIMKSNHLVAGLSLGAYYLTHGDTTTATLSITNCKNLRDHDGWEIGNGGWWEIGRQGGANGGWWHGDVGKLAQGDYTQAQLATAMDLHFAGGRRALEDTLGFGATADWYSASNSSSSDIVLPYAQAAGYRYIVSSNTTTSSSNARPNYPYAPYSGWWGMWGTGGVFASFAPAITAIPGYRNSRWEINQSLNESMDSTTVRKMTRFALITNGLLVFNLHSATASEASLAGVDGFKQLCDYWGALIAQGRLDCVVPSVGFKTYYDNKWSDTIPWGTSNFKDLDKDGNLDMWCSGTSGGSAGNPVAADTALLNTFSTSSTFKYAGLKTKRLNWTGAGSAAGLWGAIVATPDSSWERPNAVKVVYPPAGAGWTVIAEMRATCDTTVASSSQPNGKYIGISFVGVRENNSYQYSVSAAPSPTGYLIQGSGSGTNPFISNMKGFSETNRPGTWCTFGTRNSVKRVNGKEWLFVTQSWDIPMQIDYLFVNVFKQPKLAANEVIITDPVIRFYNRNSGEVIDAQ